MSLWSMLMRSWLRVLIVAGFAGAAVFAALALAPARYVASTEIHLPTPATPDEVAAAITALRSADLARQVVADLDLARLPAFNGAYAMHDIFGWLDRLSGRHARTQAGARGERVVASFMRSLHVAPTPADAGIMISVTARTPELAARIADHLAEGRIEAANRANHASPADTQAAPGSRKEQLSEDLAAIEAEIARLKSSPGDQRREDLAEALAQTERERGDALSRAETVRALLGKGKVEAIAELQTSPAFHQLIAERVRVEVQKSGAERTLPSGHPRIRDLQARLSELRWQMFREATAIAEMLDAEAKSAAAREADARARLAGADARADTPADATSYADRLVALEDDAAEKRRALESLGVDEAASSEPVARASARSAIPKHVSPARAAAIPAFPHRGQFALLTTVSILMIGFVAVIVRILLAGNRRSPAETGFAGMAATARDRADVRLEATATEARPPEALNAEVSPVGEEHAQQADARGGATSPIQASEPGQFVILSTTADAARHLAGRAMRRKGYRTLLVADRIDGAAEARDLVTTLTTADRRCVLVDWSRDGRGVAAKLGAATRPGMNDLLDGRAGFDDVIARLPESDAHFIAAGAAPADPARPLDADWINLVLDALDEAYDHIVVMAQMDEARNLFETIEGRFDAGIVMSDRRSEGSTINAGPGVFLGFEVTEIYIVQMDLAQRQGATRRLKRARRQAAA